MNGAYNGNDGEVNRPASIERPRVNKIVVLDWIESKKRVGATWKEVSDKFGYHHGQSSSVLTNLHKNGSLFAKRDKRGGCHVYIHTDYRHYYSDLDCFDEPVRTRSGATNEAIAHLVKTVNDFLRPDEMGTFLETKWGLSWAIELGEALDRYKEAAGK